MAQIVHEFTITRKDTEYELKASFEVSAAIPQPIRRGRRNSDIDRTESGRAELVGEIFLADGGIPWDGRLTRKEKEQLEDRVYETWLESNEPNDRTQRLADDSCIVDDSFDSFDDNMSLKTVGLGEIYW